VGPVDRAAQGVTQEPVPHRSAGRMQGTIRPDETTIPGYDAWRDHSLSDRPLRASGNEPMSFFGTERPLPKVAIQGTSFAISRGALLIATFLVARSAGAGAYGAFALGLVVFQGGLFLRDAGLGQALIVMGSEHEGLLWPAFLITTLIGVVLATLMFVGAEAITSLLRVPDAGGSLRILALAFGVGSLGVASLASLERSLRFGARAVVDVTAYLSLLAVTVIGLVAGLGAVALAWGYLAQGVCQAVGGPLLVQPWRDRHGAPIGKFLRYGGLLWLTALLAYLATNIDNMTVGYLGGAAALGTYAFAYSVGSIVTLSVAQVISRVALPYISRDYRDPVATRRSVTTLMPITVWASLAPAVVLIALAPEIMGIIDRSGASAPVLVALAAYGVVRSFGVISGTALAGLRLARVTTASAAANVLLMVITIPPAFAAAGPLGAAVAVLLSVTVSVAIQAWRLIQRDLLDGVRIALAPAIVLAMVAIPVLLPGGAAILAVRLAIAALGVGIAGNVCWRLAFGPQAIPS